MYFARKAERRGSKLTWERDRELAYNAHRRNLKNMKSSLSIEPPRQFAHLKRNLKKEQMLEDRYSQIEHENRILLSKMSEMMKHSTMDLHAKSYRYGHSLNRDRRRHELQRITQDNQKILRRIQHAMPQYNHWEWEEDRKKQEQLLRRIGEYEPPMLEKSTTGSRRGILASTGASTMAGPGGYPGVDMGMDSTAGAASAYPGSAGMPGGGASLASSFAGMSLGK